MSVIRLATSDDLNRVLRIVQETIHHLDEQDIYQWDDYYPDQTILESDINKKHMYIAGVAGKLTGFVTLSECQEPEYEQVAWRYHGKILVVHRLTVHPDYQREGFASQLMDFAEDFALQREVYDSIRLDAFAANPAACGLYEKRGYLKAGEVTFRKGTFFCYEKPIESTMRRTLNFDIVQYDGKKIAVVNSDKIEITKVQDALDLMANADYQGAGNIIIQKENLPVDFFDLKSKFAGEILQKFVNYRKRLAIVGDFSVYSSKALHDFILESNKTGNLLFVPSIEIAKERLTNY